MAVSNPNPHREELHQMRWELLEHVNALTDRPMTVLSFVWVGLLVIDLTSGLGPTLALVNNVIWGLFVADFVDDGRLARDAERRQPVGVGKNLGDPGFKHEGRSWAAGPRAHARRTRHPKRARGIAIVVPAASGSRPLGRCLRRRTPYNRVRPCDAPEAPMTYPPVLRRLTCCASRWLAVTAVCCAHASCGFAADGDWVDLSAARGFDAWRKPTAGWHVGGGVGMDPANAKRLVGKPGSGVLYNGPTGRAPNLLSKQAFGDVEVHVEFLIPKGSNSGLKFEGLYEIQIFDSWGVKRPKATDCGGIYPRAELGPPYHHIDEGIPPRVNAARPAGEWQTLDATFHAPRFDAGGRKLANARVVRAVLNGQLIHENVELKTPTGNAWHDKEVPTGPLLLQGDHGPVAFRHVRVRPSQGRDAD